MKKLKQGQRIYFKINDLVEGYGEVNGDYDLLVIVKPEKPINDYSHIYITRTQILDGPQGAPIVEEESQNTHDPKGSVLERP